MSIALQIYTIGAGDLLQEVFNAIAAVFNNKSTILAVTHLAILLGGLSATFLFAKSRDLKVLIQWAGLYVLVTSLMLYPKCTVEIMDRTGTDMKPRAVDNVPLSLGIFASLTSRIGIGMAEIVETVFHMPNDMSYNQTGMLMGSKLVLEAKDFQITDPAFSQTLNEFMQQCVFYDLLLNKYSVNELLHAANPWEFIKQNTSVARAFPLNNQITICKTGASQLDQLWKDEINRAAAVYGAQILGSKQMAAKLLLSRLSEGFGFLTKISEDGSAILQKNLLANAMSQAVAHLGASTNAPAALAAYEDTKTELQIRHTLDATGREAGLWMQELKNILEAIIYGSFILVYFLSYFPFGLSIVKNYLFGMFYLQSLAPMYAIVNFAASFYAENRSLFFAETDHLSLSNLSGMTQANADAMALAGYLTVAVTLGGGYYLYRGLPGGLQSIGQYLGGVVQNSATHVAAEAIGGNLSVGNTNFANHSLFNTNANHFDANARHASGMLSLQTSTGGMVSVAPNGQEIMDTRASLSNLSVGVHVAESIRTAASTQAQTSYTSAFNQMQAAGEHYATALRLMEDFSHQKSYFEHSGQSYSETKTMGLSHSAQTISQLVDSFAKEHHVSHERATQVLGQVYADARFGTKNPFFNVGVGASASLSSSMRSSFGSLYNHAERFSKDHHFSEVVDSARREAEESHYRTSHDEGSRFAASMARSFDQGDSLRREAASSFSKADSYSTFASQTTENAASINANYNQEFYEWMKKQPSIYGQGTMSHSMIDSMSVAELQSYADKYTQEKTTQALSSFNSTHGLNKASSHVFEAYEANNHSIEAQSQMTTHDNFYKEVLDQKAKEIGSIDASIKQQVKSSMDQDEASYERKMNSTLAQGYKIETHAKAKVKGKVIGSLPKKGDEHE